MPLLEGEGDGVERCTAVMRTVGEGPARRGEREGEAFRGKRGNGARKPDSVGMLDGESGLGLLGMRQRR